MEDRRRLERSFVLRLKNTADSPMTVRSEPDGQDYRVPAGSTIDIEVYDPFDNRVDIEVKHDGLIVHAPRETNSVIFEADLGTLLDAEPPVSPAQPPVSDRSHPLWDQHMDS